VSRLLVAAVLVASVVAGCGGNDDASSSVGTDPTAAAAPSDGTRELNIPAEAPGEAPKLTTQAVSGEFQGIDFAAYDAAIDDLLFALDEYWATTLPDTFGTKYSSPADAFAYYPDENPVGCGGQPAVPGNAEYCPADQIISWDEPGLMVPFYSQVGDMAVGFVLAHEWGHLIQQELGLDFPLTIEAELNADCLAGDFAGALADEGLLEGGESLKPGTDLGEAADAIFTVGDDPSVPWYDPQAHGTSEERLDAFSTGYDQGAQACVDQLGPGFSKTL
jgi:predicted metalloprotease